MAKLSVVEVEARSYELDPHGHLNNAVHVNRLDHGRLCRLRDRRHTYDSLPETFGVRVVVVRQDLRHQAQVRLGDPLEVRSRVVRLGRTSFTFEHGVVFPDGRLGAGGEVRMVCIGPDGAPVPTPPGLRSLLES